MLEVALIKPASEDQKQKLFDCYLYQPFVLKVTEIQQRWEAMLVDLLVWELVEAKEWT